MSIDSILNKVISLLKEVPGIDAVVLGGSRALGDFKADSDIDIGIYYSDGALLDLAKLSGIASELDDEQRENLITPLGGWGPWINGGGWLVVGGIHLDFLLRDLRKVAQVIDDCCNGVITIDYQPGHPHGFVNAIYMAEVHFCKALWDPGNIVAGLKEKTTPYPPSLQQGIIGKFLWEADFSLHIAEKGISRNDLSYAAGGIYRTVACLVQVLFSINETYIMNEKGAVQQTNQFAKTPLNFAGRVNEVFALLTWDSQQNSGIHMEIESLVQEVKQLCENEK